MRIDHVQIRVPNFEETIEWYKDKLGFREQVSWTVKALPGLRIAYLELNGFRMEIIGGNFTSKRKAPANFQEALNVEGYGHICFEVGNVDAVLAELNKRGVSTFVPAATYPLGNTWRRVSFVLDNNSNVIEFGEPLTMTKPQRT
ncbi:VOC family protein [Chroococcidiopsis sp. SAG 2025]|uniref:VOC family protein n=1 Tax=Chroococcidiopsis sp. SAG 2025 TaxID=171389 RepID=UPI00293744F4|nr:VOC family protein [Chroococcidiopsis sp. SAG 2025]